MTKKQIKAIEQHAAKEFLIKLIGARHDVYVVQKHVSTSGMQRRLRLFVVDKAGDLRDITYHANVLMEWGMDPRGLKVNGCGMDMHFHAVYTLSHILYDSGYRLTKITL